MKVLILSSAEDLHTREVFKNLQELKVETDLLTLKDFAKPLAFEINSVSSRAFIERDGKQVDFSLYSSIWHRRPGLLQSNIFVESWIGEMVEKESRATVNAIWRSLKCLWVNSPFEDAAALHKLWQLQLAAEIGLQVPNTLVTNQPRLVKEFYERCQKNVIYKLISENSVFSIPMTERPAGIGTLRLREEDLEFLQQVELSPHLFQEKIEKDFEIRVTVVGQQLFAIRIDSQQGKGHLDWRIDYSVPMYPYDLPEEIRKKCLRLLKRLNLNYGAFDFVVTPQGNFVFLEVNCAGQFLWVEKKTGLPISLAVAKLLAGQAEPICPA